MCVFLCMRVSGSGWVEYIYEACQRRRGIAGRDMTEWIVVERRTNGNRVSMYIFQTIWHLSRCIQLNAVLMMICHDNVCCFYTDSFSGVSLYFCFRFSSFFINIYFIIIFVHIFSSFILIFINKYVCISPVRCLLCIICLYVMFLLLKYCLQSTWCLLTNSWHASD